MGHGHALLALFLQLALAAIFPALVAAQAQATRDSQCGGQNWTGPTTCSDGQICVKEIGVSLCKDPPNSPAGGGGSPQKPPPTQSTPPSQPLTSPPPAPPPASSPVLPPPSASTETSSSSQHVETTAASATADPSAAATDSSQETQTAGASSSGHLSSPTSSIGPGPQSQSTLASSAPSASSSFTTPGDLPVVPPNSAVAGPTTSPASDAVPSVPVLASSSKPDDKTPIIVGVLVPVLLLFLAAAGFVLYKRRQRARDRREWERTHFEIAEAVRQVAGPGVTGAGGAPYATVWAPSRSGDLAFASTGTAAATADPFVDKPHHWQDAEHGLAAARSPFYAQDEAEYEPESRPASLMDSSIDSHGQTL
ncbi:hypothetical protein DFH06DRAFT_1318278 [Mycena polygramma]|nr:hypothetical protein DFH06DRAFT_1318278 [Mycena polygramma]